MSNDDLACIREKFIESIGLVAQGHGLPRIAGRMFGLLVFDKGPYSFGELAELLQVSRGSISSSARMLEQRGVIERVAKPGDRQDYFQLSNEPYSVLLHGAVFRAAKARKVISGVARKIPKKSKELKQRLEQYASFYEAFEKSLTHVITSIGDPN